VSATRTALRFMVVPLALAGALASAAPPRQALARVGKPSLPIAISYELARPAAGEAIAVRVTVQMGAGVEPLGIDLDGGSGLVVAALAPSSAAANGRGVLSRAASLTPLGAGPSRLVVTARGQWRGRAVARTLVIPIESGRARRPSRGTLESDPSGRLIVSLPAQDTR